MKELDEYGLLIRSSGGFSKPNHLYMRIPCIELISEPDVKQTDENTTSIGMKAVLHSVGKQPLLWSERAT